MTNLLGEYGELLYPEWQKPLQAALLELDREKLKERIAAAEDVLLSRQKMILQNPGNHSAERIAIADGLSSLRSLKKHTEGDR